VDIAPRHEHLDVWKLSHRLALDVYRVTKSFPVQETYGLTAQLRRAALAIPTNLAEGNARGSSRENVRFCLIARGSLAEVRYLLRFAYDLGILPCPQFERLAQEYDRFGKMLYFFITSMQGDRKW
jgi:four helix bundle protein